MRIILITQGVSRIVDPLFDSEHEIVGVLESAPRKYNKKVIFSRINRVFRWFYSKFISSDRSLKFVCKNSSIPYRFMTSSDDEGLVAWLREKNPDLMVVFSMSQLLKKSIFSIPTLGTINLHPSFLPEYRGPNPDFWQYLDMEEYPGATVHYIDDGEDTGDIIFQDRMYIPLGTKSPERLDQLVGKLGVALILEALNAIESGHAPRVKQPLESPTRRARNLQPGEHKTVIDWENWPVERVWHVLRGTELWLNALPQPAGVFRGQRWSIGNYDTCSRDTDIPGKIYRIRGRRYVAASDGRIFLSLDFRIKRMILGFIKHAK